MSAIEHDRRSPAGDFDREGEDLAGAVVDPSALLLVDDDDDLRFLLGEFLREQGYEIAEAHDGADALAQLHTSARLPIAIITDLAMPRLDGWQFIETVHAEDRLIAVSIIVVSASASPPPGVCCLCKPLERELLIDALTGLGAPPPADRSCAAQGASVRRPTIKR